MVERMIRDVYEQGNIRLMLGDCMDLMADSKNNQYDIAIVDPPYGGDDAIDLENSKVEPGKKSKHYAKRPSYESFENIEPEANFFTELERVSKNRIIWGFNFLSNCHERGGIYVWDKKGTAFGRAELALATMFKSVRIYELEWNGFIKYDGADDMKRIHNTEKPTRLYEFLIMEHCKKGATILDTHGGSMTHAIAVDRLNKMEKLDLKLDIIESNEKIYKKAVDRFKVVTRQQTLF